MKKIKNKYILRLEIIIISLLFILIEMNSILVYGELHTLIKNNLTTENIVEFQGNIAIKGNKLNFLYPYIEIPNNQSFNVTSTIIDGTFYIDSVLRINIDINSLIPNHEYKLGKILKTFITITRPNYSFGKFVGKLVNFNKTKIFSEETNIDLPFVFKSTKNYDDFCIVILAIESIIGIYSLKKFPITYKVLNFKCIYNQTSFDIIPPFTLCYLEGNEIT